VTDSDSWPTSRTARRASSATWRTGRGPPARRTSAYSNRCGQGTPGRSPPAWLWRRQLRL